MFEWGIESGVGEQIVTPESRTQMPSAGKGLEGLQSVNGRYRVCENHGLGKDSSHIAQAHVLLCTAPEVEQLPTYR